MMTAEQFVAWVGENYPDVTCETAANGRVSVYAMQHVTADQVKQIKEKAAAENTPITLR